MSAGINYPQECPSTHLDKETRELIKTVRGPALWEAETGTLRPEAAQPIQGLSETLTRYKKTLREVEMYLSAKGLGLIRTTHMCMHTHRVQGLTCLHTSQQCGNLGRESSFQASARRQNSPKGNNEEAQK